jgi:hypothetical protein
MAADKSPYPASGEPPRLPPVGRVGPADPTIRVNPVAGAGQATPPVPVVPFTPRLPAAPVSVGRSMTTRLAEAATAIRRYEPPAPLTNPLRHPLRWLAITAVTIVGAVVFAHLGALFITGLYYLFFEVNPSVTAWWHTVLPDVTLRHTIRDAAEGFYGGAIAQQLVWNPFTNRRAKYLAKPGNRLDRLEDRLRIPNLRSGRDLSFWQIPYALFLWAPIYGSVGFTAAYLLDSVIQRDLAALQHTVLALNSHTSMWQRTASMDTSDWNMKVVGVAASFCFGRRPLRKVFDGIQLWFAEGHVSSHHPEHWYYPPTFRARCAQVSAKTPVSPPRHGRLPAVLAVTTLISAAVLIGLGYYVLAFATT